MHISSYGKSSHASGTISERYVENVHLMYFSPHKTLQLITHTL